MTPQYESLKPEYRRTFRFHSVLGASKFSSTSSFAFENRLLPKLVAKTCLALATADMLKIVLKGRCMTISMQKSNREIIPLSEETPVVFIMQMLHYIRKEVEEKAMLNLAFRKLVIPVLRIFDLQRIPHLAYKREGYTMLNTNQLCKLN